MTIADDVTSCSFGRKNAPRMLAEVASESVDPRNFFVDMERNRRSCGCACEVAITFRTREVNVYLFMAVV